MSLEETFTTLRRLPEDERAKLLEQIQFWLQQTITSQTEDIQRAVAVVQRTWATLRLERETLRWLAESKELEYEVR